VIRVHQEELARKSETKKRPAFLTVQDHLITLGDAQGAEAVCI